MEYTRKKTDGFTLIELLVVIAIIGMLSSIVLASLNTARSKARDARRIADLKQIATALALYYDSNNSYPDPTGACGSSGIWSSWGCWATFIPTTFIPTVPKDPSNSDLGNCGGVQNCHIYEYCRTNGGQGFVVAVNLENAPSQALGNPSAVGCSNGGPNWYWVTN